MVDGTKMINDILDSITKLKIKKEKELEKIRQDEDELYEEFYNSEDIDETETQAYEYRKLIYSILRSEYSNFISELQNLVVDSVLEVLDK